MEALHYTLDQVSRELGLSVGVVRQLARQFHMPRNYYHPIPGQPRLMLFDAAEAAILEHIQTLLASGQPLEEVKVWFKQYTEEPQDIPLPQDALSRVEQLSEDKIMAYDQPETLNKHLAESTFDHYRMKTQPRKHTMATLLKRLDEEKHNPRQNPMATHPKADPQSLLSKSRLFFSRLVPAIPVASPGKIHPASPQTPWMTEALKQRARRLQLELLSQSH